MTDFGLRMNRAPAPFRKTVTLVSSAPAGPLFHDAWNGTGTANGRAADTGQVWGDGALLTPGSAALVTLTGTGEATSVPGSGATPFAQAMATIADFSPASIDFTTVFRVDSNGTPATATILSNQEVGFYVDGNPDYYYVGFGIFGNDTGERYINIYAYDSAVGWPPFLLLSDFGVNCDLDVEHTVIVKVRGLTVTVLYDTVEILSHSLNTISAVFNYIVASVDTVTGQGYLPHLLDSKVEIV